MRVAKLAKQEKLCCCQLNRYKGRENSCGRFRRVAQRALEIRCQSASEAKLKHLRYSLFFESWEMG